MIQSVNQFVLDSIQEFIDFFSIAVGNYYLESLQSPECVVIVGHQAETMKKRFDNISLFGELNNVLGLQGKHDNEFSDDVSQLGNPGFIEFHEIVQNVYIDEI